MLGRPKPKATSLTAACRSLSVLGDVSGKAVRVRPVRDGLLFSIRRAGGDAQTRVHRLCFGLACRSPIKSEGWNA